MRPASRGFGPRLLIRALLRMYLPVDNRGALIGGTRHLRVFISIHTTPGRTGPGLIELLVEARLQAAV